MHRLLEDCLRVAMGADYLRGASLERGARAVGCHKIASSHGRQQLTAKLNLVLRIKLKTPKE
jgi:hypothetical protein